MTPTLEQIDAAIEALRADYATIPVEGGFKIDSWKFVLAIAEHNETIEYSLRAMRSKLLEKASSDAVVNDSEQLVEG